VFFVDSLGPEGTSSDRRELRPGDISVRRKLNDGRTFQIYKIFYTPEELTQQLAELGWDARIGSTEHFLLYGEARRRAVSISSIRVPFASSTTP
jgi:hypothetical protein